MQFSQLSRRKIIGAVGGAAAWPMVARAQRPDQMRRIGVFMNRAADDSQSQTYNAAFLQQFGWTVGRNILIQYRYGSADGIHKYAAELVALAPDVILAPTSLTVQALQQVTRTIPIVFVQVIDPVGGFAASLAHPGGNATGFTCSNIASAGNGSSCSKRSRPISPERRSLATPIRSRKSACWAQCNPWHSRSAWSCVQLRHGTPARSSALSLHSRTPAMAA